MTATRTPLQANDAKEGQRMLHPAQGLIEAVQREDRYGVGETVLITIWVKDAGGHEQMVGLEFNPEFAILIEAS